MLAAMLAAMQAQRLPLAALALCVLLPRPAQAAAASAGLRFPKEQLTSTEPCFHQGRNATGQCRMLTTCPSALRELRNNMYPQLCGFVGRQPNVCCPEEDADNRVMATPRPGGVEPVEPVTCKQSLQQLQQQKQQWDSNRRYRPGDIARQKCREYVQYVCQEEPSAALMLGGTDVTDRCHYRVELISGGKQVDPMEFPHMVLLGYGARKQIDYACGGTLISPNFVLTAAHCQISRSSGPAVINDYVRPACLHTDSDGDPTGLNAIATGWGATGPSEDQSEHLLKVNLAVIPTDHCRSAINVTADSKLSRGIIDSQLCAGGASPKDTCPGDSGGPLQVPTNVDPYCQYRVVGLVSFGPPCGIGLPGVYTRVATYVHWIESVVWPQED
ncbi:serine protease persephone-like isoform X2 [Thrips palmi]|uniref:Serine protease persephone-like isoform X2 n=1 Tax=Thrips palmi TaxID=161013 RepID=A0A6P8YC98_THRPL|nr:serine protease persephone-like isoform X2 [Thrips palmi]